MKTIVIVFFVVHLLIFINYKLFDMEVKINLDSMDQYTEGDAHRLLSFIYSSHCIENIPIYCS